MRRRTVVTGISAVALAAIRIHGRVGIDDARAVVFHAIGAGLAVGLQARRRLSPDTNAVSLFDMLHVPAYADSFADDLVANNAGVDRLAQPERRV